MFKESESANISVHKVLTMGADLAGDVPSCYGTHIVDADLDGDVSSCYGSYSRCWLYFEVLLIEVNYIFIRVLCSVRFTLEFHLQ